MGVTGGSWCCGYDRSSRLRYPSWIESSVAFGCVRKSPSRALPVSPDGKKGYTHCSFGNRGTWMKVFLIIVVALVMTGCVTTKQWSAVGGSRGDGVVRLAYEVSAFEQARVSDEQGVNLAAQRCLAWGYSGAEAFGGTTRQCSQPAGFGGCNAWTVTKEYQCTGSGADVSRSYIEPTRTSTGSPMIVSSSEKGIDNSTQTVLSAQSTSKQLGCGDVRSYGGEGQFIAACNGHEVIISCDSNSCRPIRSIQSSH